MKVEGFKEGNSNAVKPLHYYKKKNFICKCIWILNEAGFTQF